MGQEIGSQLGELEKVLRLVYQLQKAEREQSTRVFNKGFVVLKFVTQRLVFGLRGVKFVFDYHVSRLLEGPVGLKEACQEVENMWAQII